MLPGGTRFCVDMSAFSIFSLVSRSANVIFCKFADKHEKDGTRR